MATTVERTAADSDADVTMNKEIFGVFGDRADFEHLRSPSEFDVVLEGEGLTVGVRSPGLAIPGRSQVHEGDAGICALFGEIVPADPVEDPTDPIADPATPTGSDPDTGATGQETEATRSDTEAARLLEAYATEGRAALGALNGSYAVALEHDGEALVATDPLRSFELYYVDVDGIRAFGTDVARVKRLPADPGIDRTAVLEMVHLGTVLGERTLFEAVSRVPFDGYLTADRTGSLDRFVYEPRSFDHVGALADRLERAIERRSHYPGSTGLLLSAGKDSRVFLTTVPDIDRTFTVGRPDSREVRVARAIAEQYDADHRAIEPGDRYLYPTDEKVRYSGAVKETLHIHQGGYDDQLDVDVMYHGLLFDTLFKGYFLEWDGIAMLGRKVESDRLVADPDPVDSLLDTLGFLPVASERLQDRLNEVLGGLERVESDELAAAMDVGSPRQFLEARLGAELERCWDRADSVHNAMDLLVIRNQPVMPFHAHLADNFCESFVAMDTELLAWHRHAPPSVRTDETFRRAIERLDDALLDHRPPNEPYTSSYLNQAERFLRRTVPGLEAFEPAWPDRREAYEASDLDDRLFPDEPAVHALPPRQKLRINDVRWWLS